MSALLTIGFWGDLNRTAFQFIFSFAHRSSILDAAAVFFANYLPYLLGFGAVFYLFEQRGSRRRLFFLLEALLAILLSRGIITEIIHYFYNHPRPADVFQITPLFIQSGNSLPSGHAALFFALAVTIFFYSRSWGMWYLLGAVLIGVARIFAGVHWPFDVLGGAAIGILSALAIHTMLRPSFNDLFRKEVHPEVVP